MDENQIIEGLTRGDPRAFRELVERYKKKVYYLALDMAGDPVDAEDISQEVFLKVFRSFSTFRQGAQLGSWLYRITYNAAIDHLRRRGAAPTAVTDATIESASAAGSESGLPRRPAADPAAALESRQLQDLIARALEKVSPQEKAVFMLRHYDELMLKDIASTLGLSIGSVKSYLFRAVRKLQKELGPSAIICNAETSHE